MCRTVISFYYFTIIFYLLASAVLSMDFLYVSNSLSSAYSIIIDTFTLEVIGYLKRINVANILLNFTM